MAHCFLFKYTIAPGTLVALAVASVLAVVSEGSSSNEQPTNRSGLDQLVGWSLDVSWLAMWSL
jgi:hypothetical protein